MQNTSTDKINFLPNGNWKPYTQKKTVPIDLANSNTQQKRVVNANVIVLVDTDDEDEAGSSITTQSIRQSGNKNLDQTNKNYKQIVNDCNRQIQLLNQQKTTLTRQNNELDKSVR